MDANNENGTNSVAFLEPENGDDISFDFFGSHKPQDGVVNHDNLETPKELSQQQEQNIGVQKMTSYPEIHRDPPEYIAEQESSNLENIDPDGIIVTSTDDTNAVKSIDDLNILLQVLKKQFSNVCPGCVDAMFEMMLCNVSKASCPDPRCHPCTDFFTELLAVLANPCCKPMACGCCQPFGCSFCQLVGSNCQPLNFLNPQPVPYCISPASLDGCVPYNPCMPFCSPRYCCNLVPSSGCECANCCSPSACCKPCCSLPRRPSKRQRCPSSVTDKYKPKAILVKKQQLLRRRIRKVKRNIQCCKRYKRPCCPQVVKCSNVENGIEKQI